MGTLGITAAGGPVSRKRQGEFVTRLRGMNSPDRTPDYAFACPWGGTDRRRKGDID
ncbi:hypothetical protein FACS1894110_19780 [Spirochaetia bacterium]|nr:hypothetical protein FACS1894110_19780 [Spirochaetia bacterium]